MKRAAAVFLIAVAILAVSVPMHAGTKWNTNARTAQKQARKDQKKATKALKKQQKLMQKQRKAQQKAYKKAQKRALNLESPVALPPKPEALEMARHNNPEIRAALASN